MRRSTCCASTTGRGRATRRTRPRSSSTSGFDERAYRARLAEAATDAERAALALHPPAVLQRALLVLRLHRRHHAEAARCRRSTSTTCTARSRCSPRARRPAAPASSTTGAAARRPTCRVPQMAALHDDGRRGTSTLGPAPRSPSRSIRASRPPSSSTLLRALGFNRLSMGVQDFTPEVQEAVNRVQPEAADARALRGGAAARLRLDQHRPDLRPAAADARVVRARRSTRSSRCGPTASPSTPTRTCPWIRANQKRLDPTTLPTGDRKLELFARGDDAVPGRRLPARSAWTTSRCPTTSSPARRTADGCTATSWATRRRPGDRHGRRRRLGDRRRARRLRAEREEAVDLLRRDRRRPVSRSSAATPRRRRSDPPPRHHRADVQLPRRARGCRRRASASPSTTTSPPSSRELRRPARSPTASSTLARHAARGDAAGRLFVRNVA